MNEIKYDYGFENDKKRLFNLQNGKHFCKLNKMPEGHLDSMDKAQICDIDFPIASTVTARYYKGIGGHKDNMILEVQKGETKVNEDKRPIFLGSYNGNGGGRSGAIWDKNGISPTLNTMQGGGQEPHIVEEREFVDFRYDEGMRSRKDPQCWTTLPSSVLGTSSLSGQPFVKEPILIGGEQKHQSIKTDGVCTTQCGAMGTGGGYVPMVTETVGIKQATEKGYTECVVGGVADFSYSESKTRRGRVQDGGNISPTLTVEGTGVCKVEKQETEYRIRKLTPRECWRIMDFSDSDFDKASAVNSNSQLYKQAGNSICRNVLCQIFKKLNIHQGEENAN